MHADQRGRDSLACDVMEAARPTVDEWLYGYLSKNVFSRKDFFERPDGSVRTTRGIAQSLAETSPMWRRAIGPTAEWLARELLKTAPRAPGMVSKEQHVQFATRLTEANRSVGRATYRRNVQRGRRQNASSGPRTCPECGKTVVSSKRRFCSRRCWQAYNKAVVVPRLAKAGPKALADYRSKGADPGHGGAAARKRGETIARRAVEHKEWEKLGLDLEEERGRFKRDILPALREVPLSRIIEATGFSRRHASMIRRGMHVPHPMHYARLVGLIHAMGS